MNIIFIINYQISLTFLKERNQQIYIYSLKFSESLQVFVFFIVTVHVRIILVF